jgi:hypothetical protein
MRNPCKILIGEHEEKKALGRPRRRWNDTTYENRECTGFI